MERTTAEVQAELDHAQADLERKVAQLKDLTEAKLDQVRKPIAYVRDHRRAIALAGAAALAVMISAAIVIHVLRRT